MILIGAILGLLGGAGGAAAGASAAGAAGAGAGAAGAAGGAAAGGAGAAAGGAAGAAGGAAGAGAASAKTITAAGKLGSAVGSEVGQVAGETLARDFSRPPDLPSVEGLSSDPSAGLNPFQGTDFEQTFDKIMTKHQELNATRRGGGGGSSQPQPAPTVAPFRREIQVPQSSFQPFQLASPPRAGRARQSVRLRVGA